MRSKGLKSFAILCICAINGFAQRPRSTSIFSIAIDGVVAQLVDGGSWKTIITLVNLDTTVTTYTINFYSDSGTPMSLQTTGGSGASITGTIPIGGSRVIETLGTNLLLSQGWARVSTSNKASGEAIFRQSVAGRPDFEASMPIIVYVEGNDYILPFDNATSSTGVAILNPLSSGITVFATFRDQNGNKFLVDSFTMNPLQHMAFSLATQYPQSAGQIGTVEFSTSGIAMDILGLRFGVQSFTSIIPLTP